MAGILRDKSWSRAGDGVVLIARMWNCTLRGKRDQVRRASLQRPSRLEAGNRDVAFVRRTTTPGVGGVQSPTGAGACLPVHFGLGRQFDGSPRGLIGAGIPLLAENTELRVGGW